MRHFRKKIAILIVVIIAITNMAPFIADAASVDGKQISSQSAAVIDFETETLLYGFNERDMRVPASMLKVMTALVIYDAIKAGEIRLDTVTKISKGVSVFSYDREFSNIRLAEGASVTIQQLLEFIIICSACAATVALAEALSGSEAAFITRMQQKALALNIRSTFRDCWGGSPDNQLSAMGMALITSSLIREHPEVLDIAKKSSVSYNGTTYSNTNRLLGEYSGLDGLKTGFTTPAGYCFIATAQRDGRRIIAVTMGSTQIDRFNDAKILLDYGFAVADSVVPGKDPGDGGDTGGGDGEGEGDGGGSGGGGEGSGIGDGVIDNTLANPSSANLILNGEEMPLSAYLINDAHYFKLRDVAFLLSGTGKQFGVESWDPESSTAILSSGLEYTATGGELGELSVSRPFMPTNSNIFFDGIKCDFEIYLIDGNNYFKLRDMAELMDFYVFWVNETRTVIIETGMSYEDPLIDDTEQIVQQLLFIEVFSVLL